MYDRSVMIPMINDYTNHITILVVSFIYVTSSQWLYNYGRVSTQHCQVTKWSRNIISAELKEPMNGDSQLEEEEYSQHYQGYYRGI